MSFWGDNYGGYKMIEMLVCGVTFVIALGVLSADALNQRRKRRAMEITLLNAQSEIEHLEERLESTLKELSEVTTLYNQKLAVQRQAYNTVDSIMSQLQRAERNK